MRSRAKYPRHKKSNPKRSFIYGILAGAAVILFFVGGRSILSNTDRPPPPQKTAKILLRKIDKRAEPMPSREATPAPPRNIEETDEPVPPRRVDIALPRMNEKKTVMESHSWDGPILYHKPGSDPIHILLVEKAIQKLHLYRYDGQYELLKSYSCATGEQQGTKREEKDEKTPEGIYFNVKAYRDNKITVFGDRAFGLNYPDVFDDLAGNTGDGIFIHGSNRDITPFSTNGCVVLDNLQLADIDKRISFKKTPVIIGERLPYRFLPAQRDLTELIPFFEQAMVPKEYSRLKSEFRSLSVIGFKDRVVAMGEVRIKEAKDLQGFSRIYLAGPGQNLLVLIKREWSEARPKIAVAKAKPEPEDKETLRIKSLVSSWRSAWEDKQLDKYIAHYHPSFVSDGKNRNAWKAYKGRLNKRYNRISVGVSNLKVEVEGKRAIAYFKQRYRSDKYKSDGYKRLEFRKKGNAWKIYRERAFARKPAGWPF